MIHSYVCANGPVHLVTWLKRTVPWRRCDQHVAGPYPCSRQISSEAWSAETPAYNNHPMKHKMNMKCNDCKGEWVCKCWWYCKCEQVCMYKWQCKREQVPKHEWQTDSVSMNECVCVSYSVSVNDCLTNMANPFWTCPNNRAVTSWLTAKWLNCMLGAW